MPDATGSAEAPNARGCDSMPNARTLAAATKQQLMIVSTVTHFRHKALAALLASLTGALGLNRLYLGQRFWWLPLAVTLATLPLLIGIEDWYQTPAFFILMVPVIAGFIQALVIALMSDERFDTRFNPTHPRRNQSGWDAVLVAAATLMAGATVLMTTIALLTQTYFEYALGLPR